MIVELDDYDFAGRVIRADKVLSVGPVENISETVGRGFLPRFKLVVNVGGVREVFDGSWGGIVCEPDIGELPKRMEYCRLRMERLRQYLLKCMRNAE